MFYGSSGILYDKEVGMLVGNHENLVKSSLQDSAEQYSMPSVKNTNDARIAAIQNSIYNTLFNKDTDAYKGLIDFSEAVIQDSLINVNDPEYMGNIADTYDENNVEDLWNKTKERVGKFFSF